MMVGSKSWRERVNKYLLDAWLLCAELARSRRATTASRQKFAPDVQVVEERNVKLLMT